MKTYKSYEKGFIGVSDYSTLILVGCGENGLKTEQLSFGEDGAYKAYIVEGADVIINSHYERVSTFNHWLKIYDDNARTFYEFAKEFNIYRAGDFGCIIQIIR